MLGVRLVAGIDIGFCLSCITPVINIIISIPLYLSTYVSICEKKRIHCSWVEPNYKNRMSITHRAIIEVNNIPNLNVAKILMLGYRGIFAKHIIR